MIGEKLVADIVEVAHERHEHAEPLQPLADLRDGGSRFVPVDRDPDDLGAGPVQGRDLRHRESMSAVSVLVIDCTTTGPSPPTITPPTLTPTDRRRGKGSVR